MPRGPMKNALTHGRADFQAGLAVVLPVAVSIAVVVWLLDSEDHYEFSKTERGNEAETIG
jgi:uncharacterized membrane protein